MSKSDALFRLVKSLNQAEKRYLTIYFSSDSKEFDRDYRTLFEAMSKFSTEETYAEEEVLKALGKSMNVKKLSQLKHYLYNSILKGLRNYHSSNSNPKIQLAILKTDIYLLYEKGLLKETMKLINKAKSIAEKYDYDFTYLDIMMLERRIARQYTRKKNEESKNLLQETTQRHLAQANLQVRILNLYEEIFLVLQTQSSKPEIMTSLKEKIDTTLGSLEDLEKAPFEVIMYYHLSYAMYHQMAGDWRQVSVYYKHLLDHFEQHPHLLQDNLYQERYLNCLNNYVNFCYANDEIAEMGIQIENLKNLKVKGKKLNIQVEQYYYYTCMLYAFKRRTFQEVIKIAPKIETLIANHEPIINIKSRITFIINIATAFLLERQYDEAHLRVNQIINEPKFEVRKDIQMMARILRIILLYEQEGDAAEFEIFTAIRYETKYRKNKIERAILNLLKKLVRTGDTKHLQALTDYLQDKPAYEGVYWWAKGE